VRGKRNVASTTKSRRSQRQVLIGNVDPKSAEKADIRSFERRRRKSDFYFQVNENFMIAR